MLARDVMTPDPACCSPNATLENVAQMMVHNDCGEIPVVDPTGHPVGVITDRDIVCRVVAKGGNPIGQTVSNAMTRSAITVTEDTPVTDVLSTMERHQIRRVPVVDDRGCCTGIIAQADLAPAVDAPKTAELVREVSRNSKPGTRQRQWRPDRSMRSLTLAIPRFGMIVATRAALGAGIGLLASSKLTDEGRRRAGATLFALGAATTIPAAYWVSRAFRRA
jgi:CBS domain-containing protein